jgi:hypothetical protein
MSHMDMHIICVYIFIFYRLGIKYYIIHAHIILESQNYKVVKPSTAVGIQCVCLFIDLRTLRERITIYYCVRVFLYTHRDEKPE